MTLDYSLISPFVPWVLALLLTLYVRRKFNGLNVRIKSQMETQRAEAQVLERTCRRLEDLMLDVERRVQEAEERSATLVPPPSLRSGLNLTKRAQAARMSRRGDQAEQIATVLGMPRNEVNLLLKVQKTAMGSL